MGKRSMKMRRGGQAKRCTADWQCRGSPCSNGFCYGGGRRKTRRRRGGGCSSSFGCKPGENCISGSCKWVGFGRGRIKTRRRR